MRTIPEVAEDIKSILNNIERTQECNGETLVDIDELVNEILTINCYKDEPHTNADRIRNMSDEELEEFLDDLTDNCCRCAEHQNCGNCQIGLDAKTGFCNIEKWLQSEVKGSE